MKQGNWFNGTVSRLPSVPGTVILGGNLDGVGLCSISSASPDALLVVDHRPGHSGSLKWSDLKEGMKIRVNFSGAVADSYPAQIHAIEVDVTE